MRITAFYPVLALVMFTTVAKAMPDISFVGVQSSHQPVHAVFINAVDAQQKALQRMPESARGQLLRALKAANFEPKFGATFNTYAIDGYTRVVVLGLGDKPLSANQWVDLGGVLAAVFEPDADAVTASADLGVQPDQADNTPAQVAMGFALRDYRFDRYQKKESRRQGVMVLQIVSDQPETAKQTFTTKYAPMVEGTYLARDMASEPGKTIYPEAFVQRVTALAKPIKDLKIRVLDMSDMQRLNMGALKGVGQGSIHDPRLLVLEYRGPQSPAQPVALVGKGITFDTGGISLKRSSGMWAMKSDLSGAAAVAGTVLAIAKSQAPVHVVGLMPLAENMPAEDAIRPGDVLPTMDGTTIEIRSTDAEGRLVLSDAITYAQREYQPSMLLNIATLTGSASRALSDEYAAVITREWDLSVQMVELGERSGEPVWPLPLHPNHFDQIKSDIADIKNSDAGNPGASIGAAVVGTFVDEELPWVHLDIAGVDYLESASHTTPKGFAGWGIRFMTAFVEWAHQ